MAENLGAIGLELTIDNLISGGYQASPIASRMAFLTVSAKF